MRPTIFRTPLNAEHVQVCELAVIETGTVDSCASGTATGSVFLGKTQSEAANKEASTHAFIVVDRDLDQLDLKAQVACSERLQARKGWQHLPASPRVSRVQRYTAYSILAMARVTCTCVTPKVTCYI